MFPDKPVARNYKTKEFAVGEFIKNKFTNMDWISDIIIKDGCSKKRPYLLLDLGYQIIIVEVDENQHDNYDSTCENRRIMEMFKDLQHRPIIFIRFNPDDYKIKNKTITSCWKANKNGVMTITKNKKNEWNDRLNALSLQIKYWIQKENVRQVLIIFYSWLNLF
jgi:hypothetical protein